jgi:hypothetical protein
MLKTRGSAERRAANWQGVANQRDVRADEALGRADGAQAGTHVVADNVTGEIGRRVTRQVDNVGLKLPPGGKKSNPPKDPSELTGKMISKMSKVEQFRAISSYDAEPGSTHYTAVAVEVRYGDLARTSSTRLETELAAFVKSMKRKYGADAVVTPEVWRALYRSEAEQRGGNAPQGYVVKVFISARAPERSHRDNEAFGPFNLSQNVYFNIKGERVGSSFAGERSALSR